MSVCGAHSRETQMTYMDSDCPRKDLPGRQVGPPGPLPSLSSAPSSSVAARKSDRWGVRAQGNSTALSMMPITIMTLFHAKIVLFLDIWILFKAALHLMCSVASDVSNSLQPHGL